MKSTVVINMGNLSDIPSNTLPVFFALCKNAFKSRSNKLYVNISLYKDLIIKDAALNGYDKKEDLLIKALSILSLVGAIQQTDECGTNVYMINPKYAVFSETTDDNVSDIITKDNLRGIGGTTCVINNCWQTQECGLDLAYNPEGYEVSSVHFVIDPTNIKKFDELYEDGRLKSNNQIMCVVKLYLDGGRVTGDNEINIFEVNTEDGTMIDITNDLYLTDKEHDLLYDYALTKGQLQKE